MTVLALDNSQIRCFLECQKKYQFRYDWDLTPGLEPWLLTGSAWGAAQDCIWTAPNDPDTLDRAITAFEDAISARLAQLSDEGATDWRIADRHYYHEALADYLTRYADFIGETFTPELTRCEVPFEWELPLSDGTSFLLTGRKDKEVFNLAEKTWWIIEHKTTSMYLSNAYIEGWRNDSQVKTYGFVGRKMWGDAFGGILVDCTSIGKRGKVAFQMQPITIPPLANSVWQLDMEQKAKDIIARKEGKARWIKHDDQNTCTKFGRVCPYFEACVIDHDPRPDPANWGLHIEHWDPRDIAPALVASTA